MATTAASGGDQARRDAEHLRLLSIFHYVVGALALAWGLFPSIHLGFGLWMVLHPDAFDGKATGSSAIVGWMMIALATVWMAVGLALAAALIVAGRSLARRRRYVFCLVVAGIAAVVCIPFGTVLGVLTIVVLLRSSVKAEFEGKAPIEVALRP